MKRIYLDYHASTPVDPRVVEKMNKIMLLPGNPHSAHLDGMRAESIVNEAKEFISDYYDVFEDEIVFTSGATESNNIAILSTLEAYTRIDAKRNKVIVSMLEHRSVIDPVEFECNRLGLEVVYAPLTSDGIIDTDFLEGFIDSSVLLVSLCAVNGEIGTVQPIEVVGQLCTEHGVLFHVDATQAFYEEIKPVELGISFMSISSHKLYGPMGVGLLYVDSTLPFVLKPLFYGGGQQNGLRSGTVPVHQVHGLSEAMKLIAKNLDEKNILKARRDNLFQMLRERIPNLYLNGALDIRHPGNLSVRFEGIDGRTLVNNVKNEISISTGSACSSGMIKPLGVLKAIGLSDQEANSTVRISIGRYTSIDDVKNSAAILKRHYDELVIY